MNTLEQWGVILVIFLIFAIFGSGISSKIRKKLNDPDWNNIFVGIIIGGLITWAILWYKDKDKNPDDWCTYLNGSKSSLCFDLYEQATRKMQERIDYEQSQQADIYQYGDARMQ